MYRFLPFLVLCALVSGCVPKSQYDALVVERDYYRKQTINQDSLADARIQSVTDSITIGQYDERARIRQVEELTASNLILQQDLSQLRQRYEALVEVEGTTPVEADSDAKLMIGQLERELGQLLARNMRSGYVLSTPEPTELRLALNYDQLFTTGLDSLTTDGQALLRRLTATLLNYPKLHYLVVAGGEGGMGTPQRSYRETIGRSILVAGELARLGISPTRMIVATKGRYGAGSADDVQNRPARPAVELRITYGD
jgi:hypothetical protein